MTTPSADDSPMTYTPQVGDVFTFTHHTHRNYYLALKRNGEVCTRYVLISSGMGFQVGLEYGQDAASYGGGPVNNLYQSTRARYVRPATMEERWKYGLPVSAEAARAEYEKVARSIFEKRDEHLTALVSNAVEQEALRNIYAKAHPLTTEQLFSTCEFVGGSGSADTKYLYGSALHLDMLAALREIEPHLWESFAAAGKRGRVIDALLPVFRKHAAVQARIVSPSTGTKPTRIKVTKSSGWPHVEDGDVLDVVGWEGDKPKVRPFRPSWEALAEGFTLYYSDWVPVDDQGRPLRVRVTGRIGAWSNHGPFEVGTIFSVARWDADGRPWIWGSWGGEFVLHPREWEPAP